MPMKTNIQFTQKELEILSHIVKGKMRKQIAADLRVSIKTIDSHISKIYTKTGVHSHAEFLLFCIENGFYQ
jgi:DNA-binding NarL/FixJ family response regulator